MNNRDLGRSLDAALEQVLERMFFIGVLGDALPEDSAAQPVRARLSFAGSPSGSLELRISRSAARSVAADFLVVEESDLTGTQVDDVVCEMANMICGAALSRLETDIRLDAPRVLEGAATTNRPASVLRSLDIGNGTITVQLEFDGVACCRNEEFGS